MLTLAVIKVINIGNLNGVVIVREKICESSLVKRICNNCFISVNKLNLGYSTNVVRIGFANFKAKRGLCLSRIYNRDFWSCLCECSELKVNALCIFSVKIFRNELVGRVGKKPTYTFYICVNIFYKSFSLIKFECRNCFVLMILMPKETKVYIFLSYCDIIEQNNRIGVEYVLIKNVHLETVT